MNVDTMLLVGDEYGNGVFTISNNKSTTEFIQSNITQLQVKNGELTRTPYTESNFSDWRVTLTHPKMILESGRQKQVGVRSLCGNKCDFSEDQYYLVSFEPSPYDPEGKITVCCDDQLWLSSSLCDSCENTENRLLSITVERETAHQQHG
ncbi:hypothetical protein [Vibrio owensii]|uniref:hypothetical protein n=1 Tax=Vibrio owensii TaxID=696485 RepID=UPI001F119622|nr:hypothetical protein [Vibrio owensii]